MSVFRSSKRSLSVRRAISVAMAASLGACTLMPHYNRPAPPVAPVYNGSALSLSKNATFMTPPSSLGWRDFFTDPRLQALIELALRNNRDLRTAMLNTAEAEAQLRVQRASLFPQIGATGSAFIEGLPNSSFLSTSSTTTGATSTGGVGTTGTVVSGNSNGEETLHSYSAGIGVSSYEVDLFGRIRSLTKQAFEHYLSLAETQRAAKITLVSQVANAYLTWSADKALLDVTQDTLKSQEDSFRLTKAEVTAGATTMLTLRQAETQLEQARANLAQYKRQLAQDENALTLLVGAPLPADLPPARSLGEQTMMADLPAGLPSDLLTQRPDIISAEHTLMASNALIGAARAAFFPRVILTAQDGVQSLQLKSLFTAGATTWSFAPEITVPIFTAGENQANLDLAKIEKNISIAAYEKAIQTAFREVSDTLVARSTYIEQVRQQQALVDSNADAYKLSMMRFRAGVDAYLVALDSQRSLYGAQQTLITVKLAQLENLVSVYTALGGGWSDCTNGCRQMANAPRNANAQ